VVTQRRYIKQGAAKKSAEQGAAKKGPLTAKERQRVKLLKELGLHDRIEVRCALTSPWLEAQSNLTYFRLSYAQTWPQQIWDSANGSWEPAH
jgi:hypothetical protein